VIAELTSTFVNFQIGVALVPGSVVTVWNFVISEKLYHDRSFSSSRFRLIPGDLCQPTDQSRSLLKVVQQPCTGHELTVGDSKGGGGAVKHFVVSVVAVCLYVGREGAVLSSTLSIPTSLTCDYVPCFPTACDKPARFSD